MRAKRLMPLLVAVGLLGVLSSHADPAKADGVCQANIVEFANVDTRQTASGLVYQFKMVIDVASDAQHPDVWAKADLVGAAGSQVELNAENLHIGRNEYTRWMDPRFGGLPGKYETLRFHLECDGGDSVAGTLDAIKVTAVAKARLYKPGEPRMAPSKPAKPTIKCAKYVVVDSRGSGSSGISPPGQKIVTALKALAGKHAVKTVQNRYAAVGVIAPIIEALRLLSLNPLDIGSAASRIVREGLNGLGALARNKKIGAYHPSVQDGETKLVSLIHREIHRCQHAKLLLVGYSQGAQVTGDVYQSLNDSVRSHIGGVALFGDPHYNPSDSSDRFGLNSPNPNERWTHNQGLLNKRTPFNSVKVLSFCHRGDPVCQGLGQWPHARAHTNYDQFNEPQLAARYFAGR